jgi:hypothetical protein
MQIIDEEEDIDLEALRIDYGNEHKSDTLQS